jgi:hypothetical protein
MLLFNLLMCSAELLRTKTGCQTNIASVVQDTQQRTQWRRALTRAHGIQHQLDRLWSSIHRQSQHLRQPRHQHRRRRNQHPQRLRNLVITVGVGHLSVTLCAVQIRVNGMWKCTLSNGFILPQSSTGFSRPFMILSHLSPVARILALCLSLQTSQQHVSQLLHKPRSQGLRVSHLRNQDRSPRLQNGCNRRTVLSCNYSLSAAPTHSDQPIEKMK